MKETIELIFRWLKAYVGTGWHWLLFLAAAVLLFFLREASKKRQILAGYCIGILFLYFFPLTAWIIMKACIGTDTYWRMFWLLPVTPVIAYVLVLAVQRAEKRGRAEGIAAAAACVLLIAVTGSCVYGKGQFTTGNRFKLNGDMMAVCNFLEDYNTDEEIYASVPRNLSATSDSMTRISSSPTAGTAPRTGSPISRKSRRSTRKTLWISSA